MKKHLLYWLALVIIVVAGCQKELSFEGSRTPAEGSLQSEVSGDCLPKVVNGIYEAVKPLVADTNTIDVSVNVTRTGSYTVYTDTVNGYYFRGTGLFTVTGVNTVKLQSSGTPFVAGVNNFKVYFDSTECDIAVPVLPAGAGSSPAVFTLVNGGSPANCATAVVNGTYVKDVATGASNFVSITVNVSTIGTYTIRATGGGMTFQKTSVFATTGTQTIDLPASGTPTTTGANTITFDAPFNTCNFTVQVDAGAVFTIDCNGAMDNGDYTQGTALTSANTVELPITVSTPGAYSISTSSAGITFSASGTVTTGTTSIILNGSGTPNSGGIKTFNVTFGASTCNFTIDVTSAGTIDWEFTVAGMLRKGSCEVAILNTSPFNQLVIQGDQDDGVGSFGITLNNTTGTISLGTYSGTSLTGKFATFVYTDGTNAWIAGPTLGPNLPVVLTVYNTTTKVAEGTFTGTVMDSGNNIVPLTGGKFKVTLP